MNVVEPRLLNKESVVIPFFSRWWSTECVKVCLSGTTELRLFSVLFVVYEYGRWFSQLIWEDKFIYLLSFRFRLISEHLVEFNQLAIETARGSHDMINRVMTKDNIGLAALLETKPDIWSNGMYVASVTSHVNSLVLKKSPGNGFDNWRWLVFS